MGSSGVRVSGDSPSLCRLCERDPYQLYQRLEQQAREYVLEMKVRLLRQLSAAARARAPSGLQGPPQAHQFISLLLEEYGALCQAARTISTFLGTLVRARLSLAVLGTMGCVVGRAEAWCWCCVQSRPLPVTLRQQEEA